MLWPRNRMSESFTSGSVGGLAGNRRLYPEDFTIGAKSDKSNVTAL